MLPRISGIIPFLFLIFIASLYEIICTQILQIDVKYWFVTYNILAFFTIFYFYNKILKKYYPWLNGFFLIGFAGLTSYFFWQLKIENYFVFSAYMKVLITLLILTYSSLWFKEQFEWMEIEHLLDSPQYYFVSALILYYCGVFFLFLMHDYMNEKNRSLGFNLWPLNVYFNVLLRSLLLMGVLKSIKTKH